MQKNSNNLKCLLGMNTSSFTIYNLCQMLSFEMYFLTIDCYPIFMMYVSCLCEVV